EQGLEQLRRAVAAADRPSTGIDARELGARFGAADPDAQPASLGDALEELEALYLRDAVWFHHPDYLAHLNCPVAIPALVGELIASAVNTAVETWDQSAGATLIEQRMIDWTVRRLGLGAAADGVFTSGGTQSNLMALLLARDVQAARRVGHDTRRHGLAPASRHTCILASDIGHFSVQKAAAVLGLGHDAVVPVPTDEHLRMDPAVLERSVHECIAAGREPIAVVATAGTTDFGTIDPLEPIADVCAANDLWFHVDAAYGCGLLVSERHRHLLRGTERADSVTVDYHKAFLQPVACSALLVRQGHHLGCVTWHADYLNPASDCRAATPNLCDKSLQTTRRFDALKLWLTLRTAGADALGRAFDRVIDLAREVYTRMAADSEFEVVHTPVLSTLVFRYRPLPGGDESRLDQINTAVRQRLWRAGEAVVASTSHRGRTWLKITLLDPRTTVNDVGGVLERIRACGRACTEDER
ncbi:MAG: pyridoxal phosphate-dependent decarboxylase family protein, partial [Halofilum sp. (in: g-proteobacteria)]